MKVFITGAGGFLGRRVAAKCAAAGHETFALHRPTAPPGREAEKLHWVAGDLREPAEWCRIAAEAEAIVHCAAALSGDLSSQREATLIGTEHLLGCLSTRLRRLVHVSTLSVYDYRAPPFRGTLHETTPLEQRPDTRDPYTAVKLAQEMMIREFGAASGIELAVIRPGMIYGPGRGWDCGRALRIGKFDLLVSPLARIRLTHVDNCADAVVAALSASADRLGTYNVVDSGLPTHWEFHRRCKQAGLTDGIPVPIPYAAVVPLSALAHLTNTVVFGGRARLPEVLDRPRQRARWRPLHYGHAAASQALDWAPAVTLDDGILSMTAPEQKT